MPWSSASTSSCERICWFIVLLQFGLLNDETREVDVAHGALFERHFLHALVGGRLLGLGARSGSFGGGRSSPLLLDEHRCATTRAADQQQRRDDEDDQLLLALRGGRGRRFAVLDGLGGSSGHVFSLVSATGAWRTPAPA